MCLILMIGNENSSWRIWNCIIASFKISPLMAWLDRSRLSLRAKSSLDLIKNYQRKNQFLKENHWWLMTHLSKAQVHQEKAISNCSVNFLSTWLTQSTKQSEKIRLNKTGQTGKEQRFLKRCLLRQFQLALATWRLSSQVCLERVSDIY